MFNYNELGQPVIQLTQDDYINCIGITALTLKVSEQLNFKNSKYDMNPEQTYAVNLCGDKPGRYILVTIEQQTLLATIRGYSTLWRCNERKSNWDASLRWPCYAMPQNQLWPIDMLPATDELIKHQTEKAA
jgi:hypothetical protein